MYKKPNNSEYILGKIITQEYLDEIILKIKDSYPNISLEDNDNFNLLKHTNKISINKINEIISSNTNLSDDLIKYIIIPFQQLGINNFYIDTLNTKYECNLIRNKLKFVNKLYFDRFKKYYIIGYIVDYNIIKQNTDLINEYKIEFENIWKSFMANNIDLFQIPIINTQ